MPTLPPPIIAAAPASSRFLHARSQPFHPRRILCRRTKTVRKLIEEERFGAIKMCDFSACEQVIGAEMLSDFAEELARRDTERTYLFWIGAWHLVT